ncbi:MAG TPA: hypothetical protein VGK78_17620 [Nocardioides sp.]|uniref:hypothetical protein n=1 Tax=Nocardioides sp. TaxID=35761 RepID=UPI002F420D7D
MTGQLRTTLHARADDLAPWNPDPEALARAGDRRLRRRRTALAGGLAGALVIAGAVALVARGDRPSHPQPADENARPLTYAVGSVIHTGAGQVDVGVKVESMVQTKWGFVFSTPDHQVFSEQDGDVHQIGQIPADGRLVESDDGWVTAWWDGRVIRTWPGYGPGEPGPTVAFDRTSPRGPTSGWPSGSPPRLDAVSDGHVWYFDGREAYISESWPLRTTALWKDTNPPGSGTVVDAAGDQVLVGVDGGMAVTTANLLPWPIGDQKGWKPGGDLAGLRPQVPNVDRGDLAPDGKHWFTDENDEFAVFDSATGQRQDPAHPGYAFAAPYQWLGDDTMAVLALKDTSDSGPISLLTCHVSTNDCHVTASDVGHLSDVTLPTGTG